MDSQNKISIIKIPECFNIAITTRNNIFHSFTRHFHNSYSIGLLKSGSVLFNIDNIKTVINEGAVYLINPMSVHSMESFENSVVDYVVISIDKEMLHKIIQNENVIFKDSFIDNSFLYDKLTNVITMLVNKNVSSIEKQENIIDILNELPLCNNENKELKNINIDKSLSYIKGNYKTELELSALSEISNMSMFHFIRKFKEQTGFSPFELIVQLRIKEAQKMLAETDKISEIAQELGFFDQSHFIKYFKKHVGTTPKEYRKNYFIVQE